MRGREFMALFGARYGRSRRTLSSLPKSGSSGSATAGGRNCSAASALAYVLMAPARGVPGLSRMEEIPAPLPAGWQERWQPL